MRDLKSFYFDDYKNLETSKKGKVYFLSRFNADCSGDQLKSITAHEAHNMLADDDIDFAFDALEELT